MVKVISDTSFLIHFATHRIKNIDSIETEIGALSFIVPKIVKKELEHLAEDPDKKLISVRTLDFIKNFKTNDIDGSTADIGILAYIKNNEFNETLEIAKLLLNDNHNLIHKAVGWMLREVYKRDKVLIKQFLRQNYSQIPRTTLRYAIERMDKEERLLYLKGNFDVSH